MRMRSISGAESRCAGDSFAVGLIVRDLRTRDNGQIPICSPVARWCRSGWRPGGDRIPSRQAVSRGCDTRHRSLQSVVQTMIAGWLARASNDGGDGGPCSGAGRDSSGWQPENFRKAPVTSTRPVRAAHTLLASRGEQVQMVNRTRTAVRRSRLAFSDTQSPPEIDLWKLAIPQPASTEPIRIVPHNERAPATRLEDWAGFNGCSGCRASSLL